MDLGGWAFALHSKYGDTFEIYFGPIRVIIMGTPEALEKFYNPSMENKFSGRPKMNGFSELKLDNGIFFNNNLKSRRRNRRLVSQALLSAKFLHGFISNTQDLFIQAERYWTFGTVVDLASWSKHFLFDIIVSNSTGRKSNYVLAYNTPKSEYTPDMIKSNEFHDLTKTWLDSFPFFLMLPKFLRVYVPGINSLNKYYLKSAERLDNEILTEITKHRKQLENLSESQTGKPSLLDMLLTFNARNPDDCVVPDDYIESAKPSGYEEEPMKDREICDSALDIILAGTDSTADSLCNFIYNMANNPQCKKRLIEEIDSVFADDMTRPVKYDDLKKLVYMDAAIKESLRFSPVVPLVMRSVSDTDTLLGYEWRAGEIFFVSHYGLLNNKNVWSDPRKFNPDRFLEGLNANEKRCYIPFGNGDRMCPGRHMAITEIKTLIALLFRKYDIELVDKNAPLDYTYKGTFFCNKLLVKLNERRFEK
ncbi:11048_t:CDS:2 [Acaulospora colombiana]|uniref:11048_t:CDS:1 n=1 Tax=Acaulospora colombiana TaxID=27376 RepID=A0ACA9KYT3_9GLOM|nr:11048_t:CDS:2 [Acaulospora colombiana]